MCEALILNSLKASNKLLQIVPCNRLWESTGLTQNYKEVSLISREHKVSVVLVLKINNSRGKAFDHIRMV